MEGQKEERKRKNDDDKEREKERGLLVWEMVGIDK